MAVGTPLSNLVLTMPPDEVSSGYGQHIIAVSYPFNYADLNEGQVPFRFVNV